jgi:hypothetical protein
MLHRIPVSSSDEGETAIERVLARIAATQNRPHRIVRRDYPTRISPDPRVDPANAAAEQTPSESYGPFTDKIGRTVNIDVILATTLIGVQRSGQSQPFMYFSVTNPPTGSAASLPIAAAGSLWITASQFTTSAPVGFVGLYIQSGTVAFGSSVPVNVNPIVVPNNSTVTATLALLQEAVRLREYLAHP